jgi:hypothetical protein
LPGEGATAEVQHNVSKGLHVITARLLCKDISCWHKIRSQGDIPTPRWVLMEA